jgi:hypothetical protein
MRLLKVGGEVIDQIANRKGRKKPFSKMSRKMRLLKGWRGR